MGNLGLVSMSGCFDTCLPKSRSYPQPPKPNLIKLEKEIREILQEGKTITLKWNCGGDEAIISSFIDKEELPYDGNILVGLDMYIANYLNLPDVGEFQMEGEGKIIEESGNIFLECESTMVGFEDYYGNGESNGWKEVNEPDEMYSGKRELFLQKK